MAAREVEVEINLSGDAAEGIEELDSAIDDTIETADELDSGVEELDETLEDTTESAGGLGDALTALAATAALAAIGAFAIATSAASDELRLQQFRLEALSDENYPQLEAAIQATVKASQGFRSEGGIKTATIRAVKMGASVQFLAKAMSGLSQISAITGDTMDKMMRQMSNTINTGTTRFIEQNAGIFGTKMIEQFRLIGAGSDASRIAQREQLILSSLQNQGASIQEKYNRFIQLGSAQNVIISESLGDISERVGDVANILIGPVKKGFAGFLKVLGKSDAGLVAINAALVVLIPIISIVFVAAMKAAIASTLALVSAQLGFTLSLAGMSAAMGGAITSTLTMIAAQGGLIPALFAGAAAGWAFIAPWLPFIAVAVLVGLAIAGLILFVEDLWTFLNGGESIMGDLVATISTHWDFIKDIFFGAIDEIIEFVKIWGPRILTLLFPVAGLFFFFDEIKAFALNVVSFVMDKFAPIANILSKIGIGGGGRVQEIQARQDGGPVSPNQPFLVGEGGRPELFVPDTAGEIIPLTGGGTSAGGNTFNVTVAIQIVADASSSLKELIKEKVDELSADDWRIESGLPVGA